MAGNKKNKHIIELLILFIGMPAVVLVPIHSGIRAAIILVAVVYAIYMSRKDRIVQTKALYAIPEYTYWKVILMRTALLIGLTVVFMYFFHPENLFIVARKNIGMLVGISLFYSVFSVYPQEFLYRTFFYARYKHLFNNKSVMIFTNAILFSFAHIVFLNPLVLALTFVGGIVFSLTYQTTKSIMLTSIEHAIYGCWLFTVGMGEMLAFPMPK